MDMAERCFLVGGMILVLVLIGLGLLPPLGHRAKIEARSAPILQRRAVGHVNEPWTGSCRPYCLKI